MKRRRVLSVLGASALGCYGVGSAAADDAGRADREVTEYDGDGSIESPEELGEAVATDALWGARTDVSFTGAYSHAEVFSDEESLQGFPTDSSAAVGP
ncbi:hypothetical protein I7X12_05110 [Halosimplex litoreum]|uniref:Uncharacterized protein n=1 Tax=Halosimplex litoreum TaxID=1198301 RepID=A0A7T3G0A3_9EURY|nr:hypothetical protein [Halosimplex litoreum]QPV64011.1 hypothetical protein I7X12_05110 [Halosimplex litoreum]